MKLLNKIQKCEEMVSCRPSPCAITKLNDILLGIPTLSFTRGLDFIHTDIIPLSPNINASSIKIIKYYLINFINNLF